MNALKQSLGALGLAAASVSGFAGQHQICFQDDAAVVGLPTGQRAVVVGCRADGQGQSCTISRVNAAYSIERGSMVTSGTASYQNVKQFSFDPVRGDVFDFRIAFSDGTQRSCRILTRKYSDSRGRGSPTPGAVLTGFSTDESGKITTGVWRLDLARSGWTINKLSVPANFVAVGGGATGTDVPYGGYVNTSEIDLTDALPGADHWRTWKGATTQQSLTYANDYVGVVYAIGMQISDGVNILDPTCANRSNLQEGCLRVFEQTSSTPAPVSRPTATVGSLVLAPGQGAYVALSGSVRATADPVYPSYSLGQFVTASFPQLIGRTTPVVGGWTVASKDHLESRPGTVRTSVLALPPRLVMGGRSYDVVSKVVSATSAPSNLPSVDVSGLNGGFVLTGIGAFVEQLRWVKSGFLGTFVELPGNMIWKLEPRPDLGGATVSSKAHAIVSPVPITGYALGIKLVPVP